MFAKKLRFPVLVAVMYVVWVLFSGYVLAFTAIGSKWLAALNGLLIGLLPMTYNLVNGVRPRRPQPVALACGVAAFIAFVICLTRLDEIYAGSTRLIALTAGYLLGLCWYDGSRRSVAASSLIMLILAALGAWLEYSLQSALTAGMSGRTLSMRLPLYFEAVIALAFGIALPLPRLARRVTAPLAIAAVQLVVIGAALLGYGGVAHNGFISFCANLTLGQVTNYSYWLYLGIAGMLLRQAFMTMPLGEKLALRGAILRPINRNPVNQAP